MKKQLEYCPHCGSDLRPKTVFGPISQIQTFYHDFPDPKPSPESKPIKSLKQIRDEESHEKNKRLWKLQKGK